MKLQVTKEMGNPHNDGLHEGRPMTGLQLYQHWLQLTRQVRDDRTIPEDKRLHATILLEGVGMLSRRRPRRARAAKARRPMRSMRAEEHDIVITGVMNA